jgi:hypothetical protein
VSISRPIEIDLRVYCERKTGAAGAPKAAYVPNNPKTTVNPTAPSTVKPKVSGKNTKSACMGPVINP